MSNLRKSCLPSPFDAVAAALAIEGAAVWTADIGVVVMVEEIAFRATQTR